MFLKSWDWEFRSCEGYAHSVPTTLRSVLCVSYYSSHRSLVIMIFKFSGTTWVQEIVWQIYNEGAISSENQGLRVPFLEVTATYEKLVELIDLKTMPSPRVMKTHLPYSTTPRSADKETMSKYIYIARNPKDVAVSYYHFAEHLKAFGFGFNGPWEFFAKCFIEGNGKYSNRYNLCHRRN